MNLYKMSFCKSLKMKVNIGIQVMIYFFIILLIISSLFSIKW